MGKNLEVPSMNYDCSLRSPQPKWDRMFPHYKPVGLNYCSISDWVGKEFDIAWVDYCGVVLVDMEEKELRQGVGMLEVSILVKDYPIKEVEIYMAVRVD